MQKGPYIYTSLCSYADDNRDLMLLLGAKKPFTAGLQSQLVRRGAMNYDTQRAALKQMGFEVVVDDGQAFPGHSTTWYRKGEISQQMDPPLGAPDYDPRLLFVADLDADGKQDFCLEFGDETRCTVLYLSSLARKGEWARPVAIYFAAYCC